MSARRPIAAILLGAGIRDFVMPALRKLADALDPAGTAPGWTPLPKTAVPDHIPDALLVRW
jgi:hypothetical protein